MKAPTLNLTAEDYARAFEAERLREYPVVDAFEARMGHKLNRQDLEVAARVLACPVKAHPPCWQHGRVIYAATRHYLDGLPARAESDPELSLLDIGTAKGFSALCLEWAIHDSPMYGQVISLDVIDPCARVARNTVAELDRLKTLAETICQWPDADYIQFVQSTGIAWLESHPERIHVAFIDGKHTGPTVAKEGWLLSQRQVSGDLAIFDDVHLPEIAKAVDGLAAQYAIERIDVLPTRAYAVAVKL